MRGSRGGVRAGGRVATGTRWLLDTGPEGALCSAELGPVLNGGFLCPAWGPGVLGSRCAPSSRSASTASLACGSGRPFGSFLVHRAPALPPSPEDPTVQGPVSRGPSWPDPQWAPQSGQSACSPLGVPSLPLPRPIPQSSPRVCSEATGPPWRLTPPPPAPRLVPPAVASVRVGSLCFDLGCVLLGICWTSFSEHDPP